MSRQFFWILILFVFLLIEICTVSLVSIWFCVGAFFAELAYYCKFSFYAQAGIFLIVSAICMALIMPTVQKKIKRKRAKTNVEALIGRSGNVTEEITANTGRIVVDGNDWMARAENPAECLSIGSNVIVTKIEGAKLIVKSADNEKM